MPNAGDIVRASDVPTALAAYTPTTTWTLGNGTIVGRYQQIGKWVRFEIEFTLGSTTVPSGVLALGLPVAAAAPTGVRFPIGLASLFDSSAAIHRTFPADLASSNVTFNVIDGAVGTAVSATAPWTWATSDRVVVRGEYEAQ